MIRPYKKSDRKKLLELLRLNIPEFFDPSEEQDFKKYLDGHYEDYFVVEESGEIVGSGGINYLNGGIEANISWDMFHPAFQGTGLGTKLTKHRIDLIKDNPKVKMIGVRTSQLSYQFYARFGFEIIEIVKDYWAKGFHLYHMKMKV